MFRFFFFKSDLAPDEYLRKTGEAFHAHKLFGVYIGGCKIIIQTLNIT